MMRIATVCILVAVVYGSTSCKKEGMSDYVAFENDTINNPIGMLEDYGTPSTINVDESYFLGAKWMMTVVSESGPDVVYYMEHASRGPYSLHVFLPSNPKDTYFVGFSYANPNEPYKQKEPQEVDFVVFSGDNRLAGRWIKYYNSGQLILAKRGITLLFTKR